MTSNWMLEDVPEVTLRLVVISPPAHFVEADIHVQIARRRPRRLRGQPSPSSRGSRKSPCRQTTSFLFFHLTCVVDVLLCRRTRQPV